MKPIVALCLFSLVQPACSRTSPGPTVEGPAAVPAPPTQPAPTSRLTVQQVLALQDGQLKRLRTYHPDAVAACAAAADSLDLAFPQALAHKLEGEADLADAFLKCPSSGPSYLSLRGHTRVPRTGPYGDVVPLSDGMRVTVGRPSVWDDAPDAVDVLLEVGGIQEAGLGLTLRTSAVPPYAPEGPAAGRAERTRRYHEAFQGRLATLFNALEPDCEAQVGQLPATVLDPLRTDASVLQVEVTCWQRLGNGKAQGRGHVLHEAKDAKPGPGRGSREVDGVHGAGGTLFTLSEPSADFAEASELHARRPVAAGRVEVEIVVRDAAGR